MSQAQPPALKVHREDSVAVALRSLEPGETVLGVTLRERIERGHKFALRDHAVAEPVIKFGQPIGQASGSIAAGSHVHVHNLRTALAGELTYQPGQGSRAAAMPSSTTWQGYPRADGRAGTRNEVWILPTVGCVGLTAEEVARAARDRHRGRIDGIHAFAHPHGCSQLGDDLAGTRAALAGLVANPNAAGVLLLGLGCESNQLDALQTEVPESARHKVRVLACQSAGDELAAYEADLRSGPVGKDLKKVRNVKPMWSRWGMIPSLALGGLDMWTNSLFGLSLFGTLKHGKTDAASTGEAKDFATIDYPRPDGKLSFDRLTNVAFSATNHSESQPCHLKLKDPSIPIAVNLPKYDEPAQRYCPAGVYEVVQGEAGPRFQINFQNCVHCKTCDIKDPNQNITWTVPEGGGGPVYPGM